MMMLQYDLSTYTAYVILNAISFVSYAYDKHQALHGGWRVKVKTLKRWAIIAPLGCYLGMHCFHHKHRTALKAWNIGWSLIHILGLIVTQYLIYHQL